MAVRQNQTVGRKDEPGSVPFGLTLAAALEGDDGGADQFYGTNDGLRVGVEEVAIAGFEGFHTGLDARNRTQGPSIPSRQATVASLQSPVPREGSTVTVNGRRWSTVDQDFRL